MNPQLPQAQLPQQQPAPCHIHGHSARIGIQLGVAACGYALPRADQVDEILRKVPAHIVVDEFALDILTVAAQNRMERRRSIAMSILVPLIQRSIEGGMVMPEEQLHKLVELAWGGARVFEQQDNATSTLDTLTSPAGK